MYRSHNCLDFVYFEVFHDCNSDSPYLQVKEASLVHLQEDLCKVKEKLVQVEEKLANYVRKDKKMAKTESKKDAEIMCDLLSESAQISKSTSSQTDKNVEMNSYIETSPTPVKNAEIQIDLQSGCSSEEIAEIIREFNEKIDQMQELHAAEIMDMETRHISESEALKRDKFVAVQVLTDECNSLKEVIETLRAKEVCILFYVHLNYLVFCFSSCYRNSHYNCKCEPPLILINIKTLHVLMFPRPRERF